ncbi:MAG: phosphotriesterase [Trueperaceae bacterium]|nr:MAG: phosphotriesterase [Trueperaceae bacterium]
MDSPSIHTVLGPVPPESLGRTLMHEHIFCDFYRVTGDLNHLLNDRALACEELAYLTRAGGSALVECTTPDFGRDPEGLQHVSRETGLHIVMGTGWYRQPFYPPEVDRLSVNELAEIMVQELTVGVGETGICAGIIGEIGVHLDYATAQEERVLRAAARAQRTTGAPLTTHASMYPVGLVQLEILREEGVDLSRVIVGHCDTYLELDYHLNILEQGAYVQFDTVARTHMNPDERRAETLVELLRRGWGERLLLSSDRCHRSDLMAFGGPGYDVVLTRFFDTLRRLGVSESELVLMSEVNPRRVLAW